MPEPVVYLNGEFVPRSAACLDIEDRGALFADGVYEVTRYYAGRPLAIDRHLKRLRLSLAAIQLDGGVLVEQLADAGNELVRRNGTPEAAVYWQVTRGPAPRMHVFPAQPRPTVLAIAYAVAPVDPHRPVPALKAILHEDQRWANCCIKSLMLLPNVLAKNKAVAAGAHEAIFHRGDVITEGTSTNTFVVRGDTMHTHPANQWILGGITRQIVLELAQQEGIPVIEEAVTVAQLRSADEVIITGSTTQVAAVTAVDGQAIGAGQPGPVAKRLHAAFLGLISQC
ncbi:MAG: D-amino acid aminotransferase [Phycisphaeraceae bacterium]